MIHKSLLGNLPPLPPTNIHNLLFRRPDQANIPDYVLHIDPLTGKQRTRSEFLQLVARLATALAASPADGGLGLKQGDGNIIGIYSDNHIDYAVLVHACLKIAVPFALVSSYSTAAELEYLIKKANVTLLFAHPNVQDMALEVGPHTNIPATHIYIFGGEASGVAPNVPTIQKLIDRTQSLKGVDVVPAGRDTLAYLVFSSGTTGPPKAAMISHGNLVATILQLGIWGAVQPQSVIPDFHQIVLSFLPWSHSYGFITFLVRNMAAPSTTVVLPKWNVDAVVDAIVKYRVTGLPLIPSVFPQLIKSNRFNKADLSSLKAIGIGAAQPSKSQVSAFKAIAGPSIAIHEGYGLSEATLSVLSSPITDLLNGKIKVNPLAKGILNPGLEARIVREDDSDASFGEIGELYLRGPTIFLGYFGDDKANTEAFADGWLKTGDSFRVDEQGYYYFEDRAKDTMKISGLQVSPSEIEETILAHPGGLVEDACVAGISTTADISNRVPRAWIVLSSSGKDIGVARAVGEIEDWVKTRLSRHKWLRGGVEVVDEIPKLPTGKTMKRILVNRYADKTARSRL